MLQRLFSMATAAAVMTAALTATAAPADPAAAAAAAPAAPANAVPAAPPDAKPPAKADRVKAAAELKRARKLIAEQKYDEAIAAISSAYALDPKTEHIYNLGVAYHLKGDKQAALDHYQRFLASGSKNKQLVKVATDYVAQLEAELKAEEEQKRLAAEQAAAEKAAADKAQADADAAKEAQLAKQAPPPERSAAPAPPVASGAGRGKRAIGTGLLVAGGAALGVAVLAGLDARSASDELDGLGEGDQWTVSRDWLHDRGESSERRALIFGIAGGALVAGGAVLYYLGERDARRGAERPVAVAPVLGAGVAGVGVSGAF